MFLIFENGDIINLDNVAIIEAEQISDDIIEVLIVTTAIKFYIGDLLSGSQHYNAFCKEFVIEKEKWFDLLDALKQGKNTFVCS